MSDAHTRALEREAATGDLGDRVRALGARARGGSGLMVACSRCSGKGSVYERLVTIEFDDMAWQPCPTCNGTGRVTWDWRGDTGRLALAAYCKHTAARKLVGACPACTPPQAMHHGRDTDDSLYVGCCPSCGSTRPWPRRMTMFPAWVVGLSHWPVEALIRAMLATARVAQTATCFENNPECTRTRCTPILSAIRTGEAYIADPNAETLEIWREASVFEEIHIAYDWAPGPREDGDYAQEILAAANLTPTRSLNIPVRQAIKTTLIAWALS